MALQRLHIRWKFTNVNGATMPRALQWKVITLLGYVAALMFTLVACGSGALHSGSILLRLATPL
jgi:hypothetical protein